MRRGRRGRPAGLRGDRLSPDGAPDPRPDGGPDLCPDDGPDQRPDLRAALRAGEAVLARAGVASPRADVELLAGHLLGRGRGEVLAAALRGDAAPDGLADLVVERARRTPLQHLTGRASFRGLELRVGPGVFVPRPETEDLAGAAVAAAREVAGDGPALLAPVVVDLCTGSGAIALAVADEVRDAVVHGVELDPSALAWARLNAQEQVLVRPRPGGGVHLHGGDAATALPELAGRVDVVVSNPPYIPPGAVPVDPEVRDHDPHIALYGGGHDGLAVPRAVVARAAVLLRAGGVLLVEHAEVQQPALLRVLDSPLWTSASGSADLTGRPRWVRAVRADGPVAGACHHAGP